MNNKYLKEKGIERARWGKKTKVNFNSKVKLPLTKLYIFVHFNGKSSTNIIKLMRLLSLRSRHFLSGSAEECNFFLKQERCFSLMQ